MDDMVEVGAAPERLAWDQVAAGFVVHLVAAMTGVAPRAIALGTRAGPAAARARQIAMYLAHTGLEWTLTRTGAAFGRHHSTVVHACRRVENMREMRMFDVRIARLEACLRNLPLEGAPL